MKLINSGQQFHDKTQAVGCSFYPRKENLFLQIKTPYKLRKQPNHLKVLDEPVYGKKIVNPNNNNYGRTVGF